MKPKFIGIAALVLVLIAFNALYPLQDILLALVSWFQGLGPLSGIFYLLLFTVCSVFFVPVSPLIMVAGTLYGFWFGYLLAAASGLAGIAAAYALGKRMWRKRVEQMRVENPRFESIYEAVSKKGPLLVFLIRLNPFLPFTLLNYLFTIPKLDFRNYMLCSLLGMTPDILFYLYVGRMGRHMLNGQSGFTLWNGLILGAAVMATVVAALIINNVIRGTVPRPPTPSGERALASEEA
jgi:uncharacterized membrane protein YdjX (TVP38/TMEM64 family)